MQNSAGNSSSSNNKQSLPSFLQNLPTDMPQGIDAISDSPKHDITSADTTAREEGSYGKSSENIDITLTHSKIVLEKHKGGSEDGVTVAVVDLEDEVEKPLAELFGRKRKASNDMIPRFKPFSTQLKEQVPPLSTPKREQLNDLLIPQEKGGEGKEKVKGDESSPTHEAGLQGLDLNKQIEGMENSGNDDEQEKASVEGEIEVDAPFVAESNKEKPSVEGEIKVEPNAEDKSEVEPSDADKVEVEPPTEKHEGHDSTIDKNEVESSVTEKTEKVFEFDLNEVPVDEVDEN